MIKTNSVLENRVKQKTFSTALTLSVGVSLLTLSAKLTFFLPFSPVPITAQTLVVLLIGAIYSKKQAISTILSYLALGVVGVPVFAYGSAGIFYILGPTGGYLLGFVFAIYFVSTIFEKYKPKNIVSISSTFIAGSIVLYIPAILWLSFYTGISKSLTVGLTPFLVGDLYKIAVVSIFITFFINKKYSK